MEGCTGLGDMFGMGSMKGTSEGDWIHIILCVVAQFGTLHSIHMHIDFELFTAFSYTGSPKTDQGGDNQARHVV